MTPRDTEVIDLRTYLLYMIGIVAFAMLAGFSLAVILYRLTETCR